MGMNMNERRAVTRETAGRYRKATKKAKGMILDEYCTLTGYSRKYAIMVLSNWGKTILTWIDGKPVKVVGGQKAKKKRRKKPRVYDAEVFKVVKRIWHIFDCMCGKRLVEVLRKMLPVLEKFGEIKVDGVLREKLLRISAATIDRGLVKEREKLRLKGRSHTRPGSLLKHQIPIRTFCDWEDARVGFVEIDLVGHDGGNSRGDFAYTLNVVDVCSGWTEACAVKNRAQKWTFEALMAIKERVPFELLGIDCDNGGEFINAHLLKYCKRHHITFTRSRANRKNDNCYVEQKNGSIVRQTVGYLRYDTAEEIAIMNEIYRSLRLMVNYFYPSMKLKEKTRKGSSVKKRYDMAKTPSQRMMESDAVAEELKEELRKQFDALNPAEIQRRIKKLQDKLFTFSASKHQRMLEVVAG